MTRETITVKSPAGIEHVLYKDGAYAELGEMYDEWPAGYDEVMSSWRYFKERTRALEAKLGIGPGEPIP